MIKLPAALATAALLIAVSAPSFADTTSAGASPSYASDTDSARSSSPSDHNRSSGVSTPSDSGSAGTITNGQSAQMPTSNKATKQDTDTSSSGAGRNSGIRSSSGSTSDR